MLMILDGWGINPDREMNAVALADTPCLDRLQQEYPHTRLKCSGEAVGLPAGIMGNSEVGHMNIGAGRVVYQDLLRIDRAIREESFFDNPALTAVMDQAAADGKALHLLGLISDGGVHSQLTHLYALIQMARRRNLKKLYIHAILDGRDTPPDSGAGYLKQLQAVIHREGVGQIATVCGRYYAMDRDKRWDRTQKAYRLYTEGKGRKSQDPVQAVENAYEQKEFDEFVEPIVMVDEANRPLAVVEEGDGIIFFNFRSDRARQITRAFTDEAFDGFEREKQPQLTHFVCMTLYDETFALPLAFPPLHLDAILGEVVSQNGLRQLRIAETEKYAHVTYFFNGGEEKAFEGEDRALIPSPRDVPTYDYKPQMSAEEVAGDVIQRMQATHYDLIVLNFANLDMVGHTGVLEAAIKACETVDKCVCRVIEAVQAQGGAVLVTADHGNAEQMGDGKGGVCTSHTLNPVPLVLVDDSRRSVRLRDEGILADIAPTILDIMELTQPEEMTGRTLLQ
jgi:2,3-bisphosphoglycerate-independent phosphoglycerate mutase